MRKALLVISAIFALTSCAPAKRLPIKGTYPLYSNERLTNLSFEQAWSNTIDFFADNGLSIKLIDKASGLIISERTTLVNHGTYENKDLTLYKPEAYVVVDYVQGSVPNDVKGDWNVRIKDVQGRARIKVNLVNLSVTSPTAIHDAKSTGNFERTLLDRIEKK